MIRDVNVQHDDDVVAYSSIVVWSRIQHFHKEHHDGAVINPRISRNGCNASPSSLVGSPFAGILPGTVRLEYPW